MGLQSGFRFLRSGCAAPPVFQGVVVGRGCPHLWRVEVAVPGEPSDGVTSVAVPKKIMIPSELYYGSPEEVAHQFYDRLAGFWESVRQGEGGAPGDLAIAIIDLLRLVSPSAGVSQHHPAHLALLAARQQIQVLQSDESPQSHFTHIFRSYAVGYVQQGHGMLRDQNGELLVKDHVREIVFEAIKPHQSRLARQGITSIEGLRNWERGHKVKAVEQVDLNLNPKMSVPEFRSQVDNSFSIINAVYRTLLD